MALAEAKVVPRLKRRYLEEVRPQLVERFGYSTPMQAPRIEKIVLNMGLGEAKQNSGVIDQATDQLRTIAGQQPNVRRARKSIAAFKLREGMPIGVAVTLRDARMYEFLDRLTAVAIPRIRDFRGLNPKAFDGRGNYAMGVREQIIFPEIDYDAIDQVRGLDVVITTSAETDEEAFALLEALGMPFRRDERAEADAAARRADESRGGPAPAAAVEGLPGHPGEGEAVPENAATPAEAVPGDTVPEQQPSDPEAPVEPNAERDPDAPDAPQTTES